MSRNDNKSTHEAGGGAEAVLALCEAQLVSLEEETRLRFEKMADVATAALGSAQNIVESAGGRRDALLADEQDSLALAIEDLTMEFQFFDEYAQRLQHVREAITLLREENIGQVNLARLEPILTRVFSLHSEQRGLVEHLPNANRSALDPPGSSVELF